ncbi:MAG TPA: PBP1A family penicillin-binding protein [Thermoanaerobaculia bacterium]
MLSQPGMELNGAFRELRTRWRELRPEGAWITIGLSVVLALFILVFAWERCFFDTCPDVSTLAAYQPGGAPVLLDRDGEIFADLTPVEREIVPLFSLPSHVAQAFLAVEDQRFHDHNGIDMRRVGGALMANVRAGDFRQGFSTLTMQLARNLFPERIPGQEQSLARKLLEIRVAREIENRYTKEEILELYLNHIYFGNRARGIAAAARQYFGVPAEQLTLPQAALLAALPKAPSHYDPRRHPKEALERRNLVLALMEKQKRIPRIQAADARRAPLEIAPPPRQKQVEAGLAPYFVDQVREELEERFGADLYRQPLRIRTTLDSRAQRAAEEELSRQLRRIESGELGAFEGRRYSPSTEPLPDGTRYLQGAVVMLDAKGGDVLAWVGGRNFAHSQFDRVSRAQRQMGSAFKPFVYAAALAEGWVLSQPLLDRPLQIRMAGGQIWRPRNFGGRYEGEVTLRDALVRSKNVVTVRLASAIGLDDVAGTAQTAGIEEPSTLLPSMALGAVPVSPLELTSAYSAFAGLGEGVEPRMILSIENLDGKVLWKSEPQRRRVLEPSVSYLITDVLSEALVRGTGIAVRASGLQAPAAGKTGTTNDGADAWFVGYTPELVAGVWIGFDHPRPIVEDATGGKLAAPIWGRMVQRIYEKRKPPEPWAKPRNVVTGMVDPATGLLLEEGCSPRQGQSYKELFLEGFEPAAYCPGRERPPRDGFPTARLAAERREQEEEEARRAAAQQRAAAEARRKAEQERAAREAAEQARIAQEKERVKKEQERLAALEKEEKQRLAQMREKELREQIRKKKERERLAEERERKDEQERLSRKAEEDRLAKAEKEKEEREERLAREKKEKEEKERERLAKERKEKEEKEREERLARIEEEERRLAEREAELRKAEREAERRARDEDPESRAERKAEPRTDDVEKEEEEEEGDEEEADFDLSGWWEMTNRIQSTNYAQYKGLRLGYRVNLEQEGNRITGRGQKWTEDGRTLPSSARTPITVTGTIDGRKVTLKFTEQGAKRATSGGFEWTLSANRTALRGSFWSTAADTSGSSTAVRMP